MGLHTKVAG